MVKFFIYNNESVHLIIDDERYTPLVIGVHQPIFNSTSKLLSIISSDGRRILDNHPLNRLYTEAGVLHTEGTLQTVLDFFGDAPVYQSDIITEIDGSVTYEDNQIAGANAVIEFVREEIIGIYRYKGSVATYNLLPTVGLQEGDVWNVYDYIDIQGNHNINTKFAWTGTTWDNLGNIDKDNLIRSPRGYIGMEVLTGGTNIYYEPSNGNQVAINISESNLNINNSNGDTIFLSTPNSITFRNPLGIDAMVLEANVTYFKRPNGNDVIVMLEDSNINESILAVQYANGDEAIVIVDNLNDDKSTLLLQYRNGNKAIIIKDNLFEINTPLTTNPFLSVTQDEFIIRNPINNNNFIYLNATDTNFQNLKGEDIVHSYINDSETIREVYLNRGSNPILYQNETETHLCNSSGAAIIDFYENETVIRDLVGNVKRIIINELETKINTPADVDGFYITDTVSRLSHNGNTLIQSEITNLTEAVVEIGYTGNNRYSAIMLQESIIDYRLVNGNSFIRNEDTYKTLCYNDINGSTIIQSDGMNHNFAIYNPILGTSIVEYDDITKLSKFKNPSSTNNEGLITCDSVNNTVEYIYGINSNPFIHIESGQVLINNPFGVTTQPVIDIQDDIYKIFGPNNTDGINFNDTTTIIKVTDLKSVEIGNSIFKNYTNSGKTYSVEVMKMLYTGDLSVGQIVVVSDNFTVTAAPVDSDFPIGVCMEIISGTECYISISKIGLVKLRTTVTCVAGYILSVSSESGAANASGTIPITTDHWREVGHSMQDQTTAGGIVWAFIHFN